MTRWEHVGIRVSMDKATTSRVAGRNVQRWQALDDVLAEYGREGWEAVAIDTGGGSWTVLLKRAIEEPGRYGNATPDQA
jgi:hypothetical protein